MAGRDTTGFYIDDTPTFESLDPRVIDLERIEVLRGPQGTLYGARSMGGTVRLITNQPDTRKFEGRIRGSIASVTQGDADYAFDGVVNLPLIENVFAVRATAYYDHQSGIYDRVPFERLGGRADWDQSSLKSEVPIRRFGLKMKW